MILSPFIWFAAHLELKGWEEKHFPQPRTNQSLETGMATGLGRGRGPGASLGCRHNQGVHRRDPTLSPGAGVAPQVANEEGGGKTCTPGTEQALEQLLGRPWHWWQGPRSEGCSSQPCPAQLQPRREHAWAWNGPSSTRTINDFGLSDSKPKTSISKAAQPRTVYIY